MLIDDVLGLTGSHTDVVVEDERAELYVGRARNCPADVRAMTASGLYVADTTLYLQAAEPGPRD